MSTRVRRPTVFFVPGSKGQTAEEKVFDLCRLLAGTELPKEDNPFDFSSSEEDEEPEENQLGRGALSKLQTELDELEALNAGQVLPRKLHATKAAFKGPGPKAPPKALPIILPTEEEVRPHDLFREKKAALALLPHLPRAEVDISRWSWTDFVDSARRMMASPVTTSAELQALADGTELWLNKHACWPAALRYEWEPIGFAPPAADALLLDIQAALDRLDDFLQRTRLRRPVLWD